MTSHTHFDGQKNSELHQAAREDRIDDVHHPRPPAARARGSENDILSCHRNGKRGDIECWEIGKDVQKRLREISGSRASGRESVLFIGTQFSILYTVMYSPA